MSKDFRILSKDLRILSKDLRILSKDLRILSKDLRIFQRIDSGRVDPEEVINELMEDLHLDSSTASEGNLGAKASF